MTRSAEVLIISTKVDLATDAVVQQLLARDVHFYRLNTEDYPFNDTLAFYPSESNESETRLSCNGVAVDSPTSIWYRRLRTPGTPQAMDEGVATFCREEARAAMLGAIMSRQTRWMSHPGAVWTAEFKPYQLRVAASLGLTIPRTVVTNEPNAIRAAFDEFGELVIKPTRSGHFVKEGYDYAIYTSRILAEHLEDLESARWSPSIYQECVPKRYDIRVTIVGDRCFAAAIDSPSDPAARIDWRRTDNPNLPHYPHDLPPTLTAKLQELMQALRLTFGAIDLVQTPSGDYVFLEVNPSGQWLWLDDMLGLGISSAVAEWLAQA
jgi:glutathione synthase/RimK-type ligase-like ATP-grasp enzyme